ncbi:MAG: HAD-IA family hydrolase [Candidatus Micrarchaeota archaeon]|nr:HAD-IA family hydrolase [Candidatus Micrarchaeota archaeon]MDE1824216.1 HAD-IA family hydrolase [Candidatus Micrarchaeota archaeon]MDE1849657.1 HAD-IA family hydrolase [Candidatus Micrarchaeota archaeon]
MFLEKYDLFIFDWDGTLSTSSALVRVTRFLKRRYNVDYIRKHKDLYSISSMKDVKRKEGRAKLYSFIYDIYSRFSSAELKPGAMELLKALKKHRKKVAVFSDSNRHRLYIETRKTNAVKYIDFVLSADSIKSFKPDPAGIYTVIDNFDVSKKRCLYVGDMAVDIFTAKFAGIDSCAVCDGLDPKGLLEKVGPDYSVDSLGDLERRL